MAAGECVVQTTNSEEEPDEEDDDWSDFTSDSNSTTLSSCLVDQSEQKCFPSKDKSWIFDNVSEKARLCFPESCEFQGSSCDRFTNTTCKVELEEKPPLLEKYL